MCIRDRPVRWIVLDSTQAAPPVAPVRIEAEEQTLPADATPKLHAAPAMDIEVVDADIRSVLRLVSAVSGLNFVVPDHVQSTVTVHLKAVPWDLALAAILSAEGLKAVPFSEDVILIEPLSHTR